jgi:hypothetical protein
MTAQRYTVRMYWRSTMEAQEDTNLDPRDGSILRQTLERMVQKKRGTLKLDLSEYSLVVHSLGGGQVKARCTIAPNGATLVKR